MPTRKRRRNYRVHSSWMGAVVFCDEQSTKMHELKKIKLDLIRFWLTWETLKEPNLKLALLKEYANYTYKFSNREPLKSRRFKFNSIRRFKKYFKYPCSVCSFPRVIRHHIISLKNGGANGKRNIIPLCELCHSEIHPWLKSNFKVTLPGSVNGKQSGKLGDSRFSFAPIMINRPT